METGTEVEEEMAPEENVTELDLGAYQTKMKVGEMQLLTVTAIPQGTAEYDYTFSSTDTGVATINGLGRIMAQKPGITTIIVTCGNITQSFTLTVEEEKKEEVIHVTDLEIGNHESELLVGKTLTLSAVVVPANAHNGQVTYRSSDNSVATVTPSGEVLEINAEDVPAVTEDMLKYIYEQKKVMEISGTGYLLKIDGNNIRNYTNVINTKIVFQQEGQVSF